MPSTYTLIQGFTVSGFSTTQITWSNIPQTYDTLVVRWTARGGVNGDQVDFWINGDTTGQLMSYCIGANTGHYRIASVSKAPVFGGMMDARSNLGWSSCELTIPGYRIANTKTMSWHAVTSHTSTSYTPTISWGSSQWRNNAAITQLDIKAAFNTYLYPPSTFRLYGIANS